MARAPKVKPSVPTLKKQIRELQAEYIDLAVQCKAHEERCDALAKELAQTKNLAREWEKSNNERRDEVNSLRSQRAALRAAIGGLINMGP